jgi:uncharacterized membrane protein
VPVNFTIQTTADTPVGGYNVTVTGKFGAQGQLQWTATVRVNVTAPPTR